MSITDELRDWFKDRIFMANGWQEIHDIADRIDAEHEAACAEAYGNGVMSVPIALDESQWVKLPVDADGEVIHIGDVMENVVSPSIHREVAGVGAECFYAWEDGFGRYSQFDAPNSRHHHKPTVEDVLREFAANIADVLGGDDFKLDDNDELYAEYAAKLRLAGDAQ